MVRTYEAMFLLNPAVATEWSAGETEIRRLLDRAGAKIHGLKRWDDRKLAYEIGGHKRTTYGLAYFDAEGDKIAGLERDALLSESLLRVLVVRADGMTPERIEKALASAAPPRQPERYEGGRDRGEHGFERGGRGDRGERHDRPDRGPAPAEAGAQVAGTPEST